MKKTLLALGALMMWGTIAAQQGIFTPLDFGEGRSNFIGYVGSRNGLYVGATQPQGSEIALYSHETGQYSFYDEGTEIFTINGITDDGGALYSISADGWNSYSKIFKNGEVTALSWPSKYDWASGDAISVDGKIISGSYVYPQSTQRHPCLWTLTDGQYVFEELPAPEHDPLKTVPQAIDLRSISADGSVLVGRLIDASGFYYFPIVYTKNGEGKWEYSVKGLDGFFIKEGVEIPTPPEEPPYPQLEDFATASDSAAWLAAIVSYQDSLENHNLDPDYPAPTYDPTYRLQDFMTKEALQAYNAAAEIYNNYLDAYYAYIDQLDLVLTGKTCESDFIISGNGRYISSTCQVSVEGGSWLGINKKREPIKVPKNSDNVQIRELKVARGGGMWGGKKSIPFYIDLNTGKFTEYAFEEDGLVTSVADDGTICYCSPYLEYTRNSFMIPLGATSRLSITDWSKLNKNFDFSDNLKFSFSGYDFDENGNYGEVMYTDSLITGTAMISDDATKICSFFWHPGELKYYNYHANLNTLSSLSENRSGKTQVLCYPNPATEQLYLTAPASVVEFIDLSGVIVYRVVNVEKNINLGNLASGTYFVRMVSEGGVSTQRLIINN
ncbi:MAG: T9SS type A sorting domain-containing protein [Bacteroidales bacterium]